MTQHAKIQTDHPSWDILANGWNITPVFALGRVLEVKISNSSWNLRWRIAASLKNWRKITAICRQQFLSDRHEIWNDNAYRPCELYWQLKFERLKIQAGRRPPSWKIEKWPYLCNGWTDWRAIWHCNAYFLWEPYWHLKIEFLKSKMADGRHFDNS